MKKRLGFYLRSLLSTAKTVFLVGLKKWYVFLNKRKLFKWANIPSHKAKILEQVITACFTVKLDQGLTRVWSGVTEHHKVEGCYTGSVNPARAGHVGFPISSGQAVPSTRMVSYRQ